MQCRGIYSDMDEVFIEGDYTLLVRMLRNIIGNSIEHNPNGCDIKVFVELSQSACTFVLQDMGCGMDEALLLRLNAENTGQITQNEQGEIVHGNGVKLVHQIVAAHNGTIRFTNMEPHGLMTIIKLSAKIEYKQ